MTVCVLMLLKFCLSLTCSRACFLPGWAEDLTAPRSCLELLVLNTVFKLAYLNILVVYVVPFPICVKENLFLLQCYQ